MRRYAQRVDAGGLAASTATTYWGYLSGFLSYGVRGGLLDRNPALAERATEELPDDSSERTAQQFWSAEQRQAIVRYTRNRAYQAVDAPKQSLSTGLAGVRKGQSLRARYQAAIA